MQPQGYAAEGETTKVCKLIQSIYGLKQSPRAWFEKFSTILATFGFTKTTSVYSFFVKKTATGCVMLIVYVDGIIITGSDIKEIGKTEEDLKLKLDIKDLGQLQYFLEIEVLRSDDGILLCQKKYAMDMYAGLMGAKHAKTSLETSVKLEPNEREPLQDKTR